MSLDYIRRMYDVPAFRAGRVRYSGTQRVELGTITGASGGHLMVRLDTAKHAQPFHPTWNLEYLAKQDAA